MVLFLVEVQDVGCGILSISATSGITIYRNTWIYVPQAVVCCSFVALVFPSDFQHIICACIRYRKPWFCNCVMKSLFLFSIQQNLIYGFELLIQSKMESKTQSNRLPSRAIICDLDISLF